MMIIAPIVAAICWFVFRGSFMRTIVNAIIVLVVLMGILSFASALYGIKIFLIGVLIIAPVAILGFLHIKRTIQNAIQQIATQMGEVASGNLTVRVDEDLLTKRNEIGLLAQNFTKMSRAMLDGFSQNAANGEKVVTASGQFKVQAGHISEGASTQAASAEEISASMEEMVANINQNLDNAREGAVMSSQVDKEVGEVSKEFNRTATAMREIEEKIGIVTDIAQKTNILAINAAIEAARAGEHGKGFAVVAAEVRRLADQSAQAAQQIGELSEQSINAVDSMGHALDTTIPNIRKISSIIQEIASASQEQQTGTSQISSALDQLVQITNENSSSATSLSDTSEQLTAIANETQTYLSRYKLS